MGKKPSATTRTNAAFVLSVWLLSCTELGRVSRKRVQYLEDSLDRGYLFGY